MIKIIGAILLVGGATILGCTASLGLTTRARVLNCFSQMLDIMKSEICERLTPLDELLLYISKTAAEPLASFFSSCYEEVRKKPEMSFRMIWTKNLASAEYLKLKPQETETISSLGNVLGRYGAEEQRVAIEHTRRCIESMAADAERDRTRLGTLYAKLGVICGISMVILFI